MQKQSLVLLVQCLDQKGLVSSITGHLAQMDCNIISNSEFVEKETNTFFMRSEFVGALDTGVLERALRTDLPQGAVIRLVPMRKQRVVLMVTKEAHCLGDLLIRSMYGESPAEVVAVLGNRATLKPLADRFEVPFHLVSHQGISREEHEERLMNIIEPLQPDYVVLAKYMRILSSAFVAQYQHRMINIHHSFLPAFVGANPYRQAFERGVKIIGATAHYVTDSLDEGPIIKQAVIPVTHRDGWRDMARSGHDIEKTVLAEACRLVFEERVFVSGNRTVIFA